MAGFSRKLTCKYADAKEITSYASTTKVMKPHV